jgi:hypothetical protein
MHFRNWIGATISASRQAIPARRKQMEIDMISNSTLRRTAAAVFLVGLLGTGSALAQGRSVVDCWKTPDGAACENQREPAHQGMATVPGVSPIQPVQPYAAAQLPDSPEPNGSDHKAGHGG